MPRGLGLGEVYPKGNSSRFFIEWWHPSPTAPLHHMTRAMLLGRYYNPIMHDYRKPFTDVGAPRFAEEAPIDADTMEPYLGTRASHRHKFMMENGFHEVHMLQTAQCAYHGLIAYPDPNARPPL